MQVLLPVPCGSGVEGQLPRALGGQGSRYSTSKPVSVLHLSTFNLANSQVRLPSAESGMVKERSGPECIFSSLCIDLLSESVFWVAALNLAVLLQGFVTYEGYRGHLARTRPVEPRSFLESGDGRGSGWEESQKPSDPAVCPHSAVGGQM